MSLSVVSAQDLLRVRDCAKVGCPNEADRGYEFCSTHRDGAPAQPTVVAPPPPAGFETEWCDICKDDSTPNRAGECSWCGTLLLDVEATKERLARQTGTSAPVPSAEVAKPESTREVTAVSERRALELDEILAVFGRFHEETNRWPLPSDAKTTPYVPSADRVRNAGVTWQEVWDRLDAGKVPNGRAAAQYKGSAGKPKASEATVLLGPPPAAASRKRRTSASAAAVLRSSPSPGASPEAGFPANDTDEWLASLTLNMTTLQKEMARLKASVVQATSRLGLLGQLVEAIDELKDEAA